MTKLNRVFYITLIVGLTIAVTLTFIHQATAQQEGFLYPPYYGTSYISSIFDHEYPAYSREVNYTEDDFTIITTIRHNNGTQYQVDDIAGYSGHDGVDYGLRYRYVLASHAGTVEEAGWDNSANHRVGLGLYVQLETTYNEQVYHTDYGHLSAIWVSKDGAEVTEVDRSELLGISGSTGKSGGPHLHFGVSIFDGNTYRDINPYGWNSTTVNDPWVQVQPGAVSHNLWADDDSDGTVDRYPSITNDTIYTSGTALDFPDSPNPRLTPDIEAETTYIIDDNSAEFTTDGVWSTTTNNTGYDGGNWHHSIISHTTATWQPAIGTLHAQEYDLYAYIPNGGTTFQATYEINHNGPTRWAGIRQNGFGNAEQRWAYLGRYEFSGNGDEFVRLESINVPWENAAGEMVDEVTAVDAIAFVLVGDPPAPTPTPSPATNTPAPTNTSTPSPTPTPIVHTNQIQQGSDDAGTHASNCTFYTGSNEVYLGQCPNGQPITSGFRFTNIDIPQYAVIQNAYLEFTVDGTYTPPVLVTFYGENSSDAQPFSSSSRPDNRALTNAYADWDITDTWTLGDTHNSPDLTAVVQEIINNPNWHSDNAVAIIVSESGSTANQHRRVIGYERSGTYSGTAHAARLVVTYIENDGATPTAMPTATPLPTATNTPTPPPTSTPASQVCTCGFNCDDDGSGTASLPQRHGVGILAAFYQVSDLTEFAGLLYQLRDDVLQTDGGQHYIDLYYEHSPEITALLLAHPDLYDQGYAAVQAFVPAIEALIDGNGDSVTITSAQIEKIESFLDALMLQAGGGALQDVIIQEQSRLPLETMADMSVNEAWTVIRGNTSLLIWQPPLADNGPYETRLGRTIPVKFRIEDENGAFIQDDTVLMGIYEAGSSEPIVLIGVANNPNTGIKINHNHYHANWDTGDLEAGTYYVRISADSLPAGNGGAKAVVLID